MKRFDRRNPYRWLLGGLAAVLASPITALAQGCAMCYNDAAATHKAGIIALRHGTLILGVPVLTLFAGIFVMAFRHRNRFNEAGFSGPDPDPELNAWLRPLGAPPDHAPSTMEHHEGVNREY